MDIDYNINGVHYLFKKKEENNYLNSELDVLSKWIYINLLINNNKKELKIIKLILEDIIYDIKVIENEPLKKLIIKYLPSNFLKYKKYNKLYPNIL